MRSGSTIEFIVAMPDDLPAVLADVTQVHQVLMNLGTNAWQAMRGRSGKLKLELARVEVEERLATLDHNLRPGVYVRVTVSDTGAGMDQATMNRIFEPFFTTKPPGEGTGLGLSVVHGIMAAHEGAVTVYSEPGVGTTFHVYFPAVKDTAVAAAATPGTIARGAGERILVIDDEEPIARMTKILLEKIGYRVATRTDPRTALELVRADPAAFDLVLTDHTMPGMTGMQFAHEIRQVRPELPVVLTSGYDASLMPDQLRVSGVRELIIKPATIEQLSTALHRLLTDKARPDP